MINSGSIIYRRKIYHTIKTVSRIRRLLLYLQTVIKASYPFLVDLDINDLKDLCKHHIDDHQYDQAPSKGRNHDR